MIDKLKNSIIYGFVFLIGCCSCDLFPGERNEIYFIEKPSIINPDSVVWIIASKLKISGDESRFGFVCYEESNKILLSSDYVNPISEKSFPENILDPTKTQCKLSNGTLNLELKGLRIGKKYNLFTYFKLNDEQCIKSETFTFETHDTLASISASVISSQIIEVRVEVNHSFLDNDDYLVPPDLQIDQISYGKRDLKFIKQLDGTFLYQLETKLNSIDEPKCCYKFVLNLDKDVIVGDSIYINDGLKLKIKDIVPIDGKSINVIVDNNSFLTTKIPKWDYVYFKKRTGLTWESVNFSLDNKLKVMSNYPDTISFTIKDSLEYNCEYDFLLYGNQGKNYWISEIFPYKIPTQKPEIELFNAASVGATLLRLNWKIKLNGEPLTNLELYHNNEMINTSLNENVQLVSNLNPFSINNFKLIATNTTGKSFKEIEVQTSDTIPPLHLNISSLLFPIKAKFKIEIEGIEKTEMGDKLKGIYMYTSNSGKVAVDSIVTNIEYCEENMFYDLEFYPIYEKRPFDVYVKVKNRNDNERISNIITISE